MQYRWLVLILFFSLAVGRLPAQKGQASTQTSAQKAVPVLAPNVAPDAPVITIEGLCGDDFTVDAKPATTSPTEDSTKPVATCRTTITRERFEKITDAINPMMNLRIRLGFAKVFPETLLFSQKAHQLGLDKDENFQALMKWKYLQAESQLFTKYVQDRADKISDAEVEDYYKARPEMFEQVDLVRIFIPKRKGELPEPGVQPAANPTEETEMKAEAYKIQKKAAAGGDFGKLEEEVYKVVGEPNDAPDVIVGKMTRDQVPAQYQKTLFELQTGQVSTVVPGPEGWHVFKVVSRRKVPLSEAKPIVQRLQVKDSTETLKGSLNPQFNDAYFGAVGQQEESSATDDMR